MKVIYAGFCELLWVISAVYSSLSVATAASQAHIQADKQWTNVQ